MTIGNYRRGIGVFATKQDMEFALSELKDSGLPMDKVTVIAKDENSKPQQGTNLRKRPGHEVAKGVGIGSLTGTVFGFLAGLLVSVSELTIPGIGTIMAAGTIVETLAITFAGGGIGAVSGGVIGAFSGLGIPGNQAKVYSDRLAQGDYLIIVEGKSDEVMRAEMILLNERGIKEWSIFDAHSDGTNLLEKPA
ncbi:hypothetical protein [Leptothoe spongobia]|uniref:DUF1269 domain-containing protein n=1 Tax=Leptothoe spongobia TAU-MAC 1115 TaxID=1967444 RepID=A0A947DGU1_9CYAN|nr:hypothetical protein [Leptothoe spongobia]MBT9316606.1 DUF1269 domain-containing protein [Leptothoe spongobia TAU-MAC 1115]